MANPVTYPPAATDNGTVLASLQWTAGAAGSVGSVQRSREFKTTPVAHGSAGVYTCSLKEAWTHLIFAGVAVVQASFSTAGACVANVTTNNVAVDGTFVITIGKGTDGSAVDPASGDIVKVFLVLQKIDPSK
jgi:hypothetical protein